MIGERLRADLVAGMLHRRLLLVDPRNVRVWHLIADDATALLQLFTRCFWINISTELSNNSVRSNLLQRQRVLVSLNVCRSLLLNRFRQCCLCLIEFRSDILANLIRF